MTPEGAVAYLADRMFAGFVAHDLTTQFWRVWPRSEGDVQAIVGSNVLPIPRLDGTQHAYSVQWAAAGASAGLYRDEFERIWLGAALMELGDRLDTYGYLDRGPDLEFVRHLRNAVGHGNRFDLRGGAPHRPARFTGATGSHFEVTPSLNGDWLLFDFMGPGDVCDLFQFIGWRLHRIDNGDPPQDLWPQR